MYPSAMIEEIAHERVAELQRSGGRSRSARSVALAARQQDLVARRRLFGLLPDRPIVTARPIRPQGGAPLPIPAPQPAPALAAATADRAGADQAAAAESGSPVAVLTACSAC